MTVPVLYPHTPDLTADDYIVLGLATCFQREEDETLEVEVLEPVPSAALEAILKGIPTSYRWVRAETLGMVLGEEGPIPIMGAPPQARFCADFAERLTAAARSYKSRPGAQTHLATGTVYTAVNYSTERKRVLNAENVVGTDDNVKQHEYTHKVL
jgi:hypothetical protein